MVEVEDQSIQTNITKMEDQSMPTRSMVEQKVKVKDKQIQTEITGMEEQHMQAESSRTKQQAGLDKVEVKEQQIQTEILETGDQSVQTRIVAKQQAGSEVEAKDQQIHTELAETQHQHVPAGRTPEQQAGSDKVEEKDQQIQTEIIETEHLQAGITSPEIHLRGVDIVAQTMFTLIQGSQNLQFKGYGFKLHVPEGSLPAEILETQLSVQVSLSGQFQMPPDCELLSAVYWVYSPCKFTKPLTVEIQHCGALSSDQQCAQLAFVSTKCTQKELPYVFKLRDGGAFSYHSSYGTLSLSQFSGLGVAKRKVLQWFRRVQPHPSTSIQTSHEQPKQLAITQITETELSNPSVGAVESLEIDRHDEIFDQYCGQVYTRKGMNDCRVHFVITKNLDAHRTAVEEFYIRTSHVREDTEMSLGFDGENISLSVSREGVKLESGWRIIPLYDPIIRKGNVDHFSGGQMIPRCELLLQWPHTDKPHVCLLHGIDLIGAKGCTFFTLYIPPASTPTPSHQVSSPSNKSTALSSRGAVPNEIATTRMSVQGTETLNGKERGATNKPALRDLMDALYHKVADKWKAIGVLLEIPKGKLASIAEMCQRDPHKCLLEMMETWLERIHPPASWEAIVEAVEFLGEEQLGKELRDKHIPTCSSTY